MYDLQKLMDDIKNWSNATFGMYRTSTAIAFHLKKEIDELIEALETFYRGAYGSTDEDGFQILRRNTVHVHKELSDCFTLLLDIASHFHFPISAEQILWDAQETLEENKNRKWGKPDENGVVEHIEEGDEK